MYIKFKLYLGLLILCSIVTLPYITHSQSAGELQDKIDSHNDKIKKLEEDIKAYEKQIETVGTEAKTLQNAIKTLDISKQKISTEIKKTQTGIEKTNLSIEQLGSEIGNIEQKIESNIEIIEKAIRNMNQNDDKTLLESFLESKSLAEVLDEYESVSQFQQKIREQSKELAYYKEDLSGKKTVAEKEKKNLVTLKSDLDDQNQILDINKKEKNQLLSETKSKESAYKTLLASRQAEKEKFER